MTRNTSTRPYAKASHRTKASSTTADGSVPLGGEWEAVDARSRETLWFRQLYTGLIGFIGGGGAGLFYVLNTWSARPYRQFLAVLAVFVIVQSLVVWSQRRRFATSGQRTALFIIWNLGTCATIALGSALDGGIESPIALMWVLPVIYMLMGYSRVAIVICGTTAILAYLAVAAFSPGPAPTVTVVTQLSVLLTALLMVLLGATARTEREDILHTLRTRLATLATVDELTSCINVRAFSRMEDTELYRAVRYRHPVSLLAIDVDHFKAINDRHGHLVGDQILRTVADILHATARKTAVVGRLGGDEFAVLCPETAAPAAALLAARLCAAARSSAVDGIGVTLSIGVCTLLPGTGHPAETLRERADAALYEAKRNGRNQYAIGTVPPGTGLPH